MNHFSEIKEQVIKNSFWNIMSSILNRIGGFILAIMLSKLLMPEGFGRYSLVMAISFIFITFSDLGINQTLIRYVSLKIDKSNSESALYAQYLFRMKLFVTIIFSLALFLMAYPLSFFIFKNYSLFPLLIIF